MVSNIHRILDFEFGYWVSQPQYHNRICWKFQCWDSEQPFCTYPARMADPGGWGAEASLSPNNVETTIFLNICCEIFWGNMQKTVFVSLVPLLEILLLCCCPDVTFAICQKSKTATWGTDLAEGTLQSVNQQDGFKWTIYVIDMHWTCITI